MQLHSMSKRRITFQANTRQSQSNPGNEQEVLIAWSTKGSLRSRAWLPALAKTKDLRQVERFSLLLRPAIATR